VVTVIVTVAVAVSSDNSPNCVCSSAVT
jgi:hypothetical protein